MEHNPEQSMFRRRDFLKASALGLGGLGMGASRVMPAADKAQPSSAPGKDREKIMARLSGCFTPLPTLYQGADLEVNLKGMRRHVRFLLDGGIRQGVV